MNKQTAISVLNRVLEHLNLNPNELAKSLGMTRSQAIYDVLNPEKKVGISKKFAEKIVDKYPFFNQLWLLTGEGSMLKEESNVGNNNIISGDNNTTQNISGNNSYIKNLSDQSNKIQELERRIKELENSSKEKDELLANYKFLIETLKNTK